MFEQDYVMRYIKEMVRVILKLLFNIDTESPSTELLKDQEEKNEINILMDMVDEGNIEQAENRLYDIIENRNEQKLEVALLFYSYLNDKDTEFLEEHGFSREEVKLGIQNVASRFGLSSIVDIFMLC